MSKQTYGPSVKTVGASAQDKQALEGAAAFFEELASGAYSSPLVFAQAIRRILAAIEAPAAPSAITPDSNGHRTRISDSSFYDEVCTLCGATDGRGDNGLERPCPKAIAQPGEVTEALKRAVAILDGELGSSWGERNHADWSFITAALKGDRP